MATIPYQGKHTMATIPYQGKHTMTTIPYQGKHAMATIPYQGKHTMATIPDHPYLRRLQAQGTFTFFLQVSVGEQGPGWQVRGHLGTGHFQETLRRWSSGVVWRSPVGALQELGALVAAAQHLHPRRPRGRRQLAALP